MDTMQQGILPPPTVQIVKSLRPAEPRRLGRDTAAYAERESGHTGNFFNILSGPAGVSRCLRPAATAAVFQGDLVSVLRESAIGCDGTAHRAPRLPRRGLLQTGGTAPDPIVRLRPAAQKPLPHGPQAGEAPGALPAEVTETIAAGRDFTFQNTDAHGLVHAAEDRSAAGRAVQLVASGSSRSSQELSHREGNFLPQILQSLNREDRNSRYGACEALASWPQGRSRGTARWRAAERQGSVAADAGRPDLGVYGAGSVAPRRFPICSRRRCSRIPMIRQRLVGEAAKALVAPIPGTNEPSSHPVEIPGRRGPVLAHATLKEVPRRSWTLPRPGCGDLSVAFSGGCQGASAQIFVGSDPQYLPSGEMFRYGIRWAGFGSVARFRIREGMACVWI